MSFGCTASARGDADALALAAAEFVRVPRRATVEADVRKQRLHPFAARDRTRRQS